MDGAVHDQKRAPSARQWLLTGLATMLSIGAVAGVLLIEWFGIRSPSGLGPMLSFDLGATNWQEHGREQLFLYLGMVSAVGAFGLLRLIWAVPSGHRPIVWVLAVPSCAALIWAAWGIGLLRTLLAILIGVLLLRQRRRAADGAFSSLALILLGAWVALFAVLPLFRASLPWGSPTAFVYQQEHYANNVLPALDVFTGAYRETSKGHMSLFLGLIGRSVGMLTGAEVSIVRLVAIGHVLAVVVALVTGWVLGRRSAAPLLLLTLAAVPLNAFAVGYAWGTPNLTGQRYLPALAVLLVLAVHAHRRWRNVGLLGVVAGIALGTSTEVGTLALAATTVYLLLQTEEPVRIEALRLMGKFLASVLVGVIVMRAVAVAQSGALQSEALQSEALRVNTSTAASWLAGKGGGTMPLHPIAAILALVTLGTLVWMLTLERPLSPRAALAAGILTAVALQWVVFANRTHVSNVWFAVLLLGLAAMALAGHEGDEWIPARERERYRPASAVLVLGLAAMAVVPPLPGLPDLRSFDCSREPVFGFCLEGSDGDVILGAIQELEAFPRSDTAVLSKMPAIVRSMGFNADLVRNRGMVRTGGVERASRELEERGVRRVIVQTPESTLGSVSPGATSAFLDVVAGAEGFQLVSESENWLVFER